jgi:archaetidylinositol phosphate synthase
MLNKLRARLDSSILALGGSLSKLGISPTAWTFLGLVVSTLAGLSYWKFAGIGTMVAGIMILVAGFLDIVDGAIARTIGRVTKRGAFLDSTLDRLGEVAIYAGLASAGLANPVLILLAISFSLLVSYTRARGESLGASVAGVGIGERAERLIVLAAFSIFGLVSIGVLIVLIVAVLTFVQRTYKLSVYLDRC